MSYSGKSLLKGSPKRFTSLKQLVLTMMEFGSNADSTLTIYEGLKGSSVTPIPVEADAQVTHT